MLLPKVPGSRSSGSPEVGYLIGQRSAVVLIKVGVRMFQFRRKQLSFRGYILG